MKQMKISKAKQMLFAFVAGAMILLTSCSSQDDLTPETQGETKGMKLVINATLPDDNSTRCGTLVDNGTHTGGMRFKWTESKKKIAALAILRGTDHYSFTKWWCDNYQLLDVTPDENNDKKATLTAYTALFTGHEGSFYCMQNASDISVSFEDNKATANLIMPEGNVFVQTERNGSSHLSDYLFVKGYGCFDAPEYNEAQGYGSVFVQWVNIPFYTSVATIRLKVTNKKDNDVTIKSIRIQNSGSEKIFPNKKIWNVNCGTLNGEQLKEVKETIDEPSDKSGYSSFVTTQCGTDGFSVAKGEAIYNYVAVHQHDAVDALADKKLDFVVETTDGTIYTAYNFDCDKLSQITGNKDFVANYTYTFTLLLKDYKLELGDVTVNEWGKVDGGDTENQTMSLTNWCSTDTYKAQREALTTLTLNGATISEKEITELMRGNFASYFPNVTTLNIKGTSLAYCQPLINNGSVTTVIGDDLTSLPANAFQSNPGGTTGVTTYLFPNVETVRGYCFKRSYGIKEISLPKLKAFNEQLLFGVGVEYACFASLTDFTKASQELSHAKELAFGATEQFAFAEDKNPLAIFQDDDAHTKAAQIAAETTLYLNENGYEYKNQVDLTAKTWRGVTFKEIKKYSDYTGKKD